MEGYTLNTDIASQQVSNVTAIEAEFQPLELPLDLRLKNSQEQLEYLLLASLILLYRSSNGSESATFTWGYYEGTSPVTQVSADIKEVIHEQETIVSDILPIIRTLSKTGKGVQHEPRKQWEDQHMFFAASHATGQAAPHVSLKTQQYHRVPLIGS